MVRVGWRCALSSAGNAGGVSSSTTIGGGGIAGFDAAASAGWDDAVASVLEPPHHQATMMRVCQEGSTCVARDPGQCPVKTGGFAAAAQKIDCA